MRLIFSDAAEADLEEIGDFIAEDNPGRAASFTRELRAACASLCDYPERFPLLDAGGSVALRQRSTSNYRIIYEVRVNSVLVVRLLHSARDHERILFPDD